MVLKLLGNPLGMRLIPAPLKFIDFSFGSTETGSMIKTQKLNFDHRIKLKEGEKKEKYLDLVRESKKLWNMKVTIIPIVIGAFGTVT